jgi:hypothetical protein
MEKFETDDSKIAYTQLNEYTPTDCNVIELEEIKSSIDMEEERLGIQKELNKANELGKPYRCHFCLEYFDVNNKPVCLPCGHIWCKKCLMKTDKCLDPLCSFKFKTKEKYPIVDSLIPSTLIVLEQDKINEFMKIQSSKIENIEKKVQEAKTMVGDLLEKETIFKEVFETKKKRLDEVKKESLRKQFVILKHIQKNGLSFDDCMYNVDKGISLAKMMIRIFDRCYITGGMPSEINLGHNINFDVKSINDIQKLCRIYLLSNFSNENITKKLGLPTEEKDRYIDGIYIAYLNDIDVNDIVEYSSKFENS